MFRTLIKRTYILLWAAVFIFSGGWFATKVWFKPSSLFTVREIIINGETPHINKDDVVRLAGIKGGDHLLGIRLRKIEERLRHFSWIKSVELTKRFPGRIYLSIIEYKPIAILNTVNEKYYVDNEGTVFKKMGDEDNLDCPELSGLDPKRLNRDPVWAKEKVEQSLEIIFAYQYGEINKLYGLSGINFEEDRITLITKNPRILVDLGEYSLPEKLARLSDGIKTIEKSGRKPIKFDLNYKGKIIVQYET